MTYSIKTSLSFSEKLATLSNDSKYDLACSCGTAKDEHRTRSKENKWIYPVVMPDGGYRYLFKTLLSNICVNNCQYCPLRSHQAPLPCKLTPQELSTAFMSYFHAGMVQGLFLSSSVEKDPDKTMEQINLAALILRRMKFKGYIHLKIIPGASEMAIRESLSLANAVSLNIETPGETSFRRLTSTKDYLKDIVKPINFISRLTAKGAPFSGVKQTTQFVVGASDEKDKDIIKTTWKLYKSLNLSRIYFSAYQRGVGSSRIPGEVSRADNKDLLLREHRLYQVDWLIRKYGFSVEEIPLQKDGNLSLQLDPKAIWAKEHPEFFPVNINKDERWRLLRAPGLGQVSVDRIMDLRSKGVKIRDIGDLSRLTQLRKKAQAFVTF